MYAVKVEQGRERFEVRRISSGFLPSYRVYSGSSDGASVRWPVIPGYVFSLVMVRNAIIVSEEEWEIIDKLSDSRPSVIDAEGKIISGPLAGLSHLVVKTGRNFVQIRANLLGEERTYHLLCETAEEAEKKKEGKGSAKTENAKAESPEEETAAMLKRVEEVGVHAAAREFGIAWQTLARIRRQAAGSTGTEKKAEAKEKPNRQKSLRTAAQEQVATDLETENAILRKQVKQMTTTLESIKKALARILDEV